MDRLTWNVRHCWKLDSYIQSQADGKNKPIINLKENKKLYKKGKVNYSVVLAQ